MDDTCVHLTDDAFGHCEQCGANVADSTFNSRLKLDSEISEGDRVKVSWFDDYLQHSSVGTIIEVAPRLFRVRLEGDLECRRGEVLLAGVTVDVPRITSEQYHEHFSVEKAA